MSIVILQISITKRKVKHMRLRNWYDLEVNSDRSEKVRYSCADVPYGFFKGRHSAYANNSMPAHSHRRRDHHKLPQDTFLTDS